MMTEKLCVLNLVACLFSMVECALCEFICCHFSYKTHITSTLSLINAIYIGVMLLFCCISKSILSNFESAKRFSKNTILILQQPIPFFGAIFFWPTHTHNFSVKIGV